MVGSRAGRRSVERQAVIGVIPRKISDLALAFEDQQVVHQAVHEIAIMRYQQQAALELLQKVFQDLKANQIQIVGGLVHDQEIRLSDQDQ